MLVFERGKPEYPRKNLSEQTREPITNSTHILHRVRESIPSHIAGRWVLSPLCHPCSQLAIIRCNWKFVNCDEKNFACSLQAIEYLAGQITWNKREMIPETRGFIFRWRARFHRRRLSLLGSLGNDDGNSDDSVDVINQYYDWLNEEKRNLAAGFLEQFYTYFAKRRHEISTFEVLPTTQANSKKSVILCLSFLWKPFVPSKRKYTLHLFCTWATWNNHNRVQLK